MLKREGWRVGKNVVYRLYREEGLCLRPKRPRRRKMAVHREARCQPSRPNQAWSMDFLHDELSNGNKIRLLTVVDIYTREALAIEVGSRLRGEDVARVLNRLVYLRGRPDAVFCDNVLHQDVTAIGRQKISFPQHAAAVLKVNRRGTSASEGRARGHSKQRIHTMDFAGPHRP
jgi:putative transposase